MYEKEINLFYILSGKVVITKNKEWYFFKNHGNNINDMGNPIFENLHREDGPAMYEHGDVPSYWINGKNITKDEFDNFIKEEDLKSCKVVKNNNGTFYFKEAGKDNMLGNGWPVKDRLHRDNNLPAMIVPGDKLYYTNGVYTKHTTPVHWGKVYKSYRARLKYKAPKEYYM